MKMEIGRSSEFKRQQDYDIFMFKLGYYIIYFC